MKSLSVAGIAFLVLAGAAQAADLGGGGPPPVPPFEPASTFPWTGFFVGAHGGYVASETETRIDGVVGSILTADVRNQIFPTRLRLKHEGGLVGLQGGYNLQFGRFVAGLELDASWVDSQATRYYTAVDPGPLFPGAVTNSTYKAELEWLGTARAKAGLAFDRAFIYGTGGVAVGEVRNSFAVAIPSLGYGPPAWANRSTEWGWAAGAGIEYALTKNLSLKVEYLHYDLGKNVVHASDQGSFPGQYLDHGFATRGDLVRGGVNIRF